MSARGKSPENTESNAATPRAPAPPIEIIEATLEGRDIDDDASPDDVYDADPGADEGAGDDDDDDDDNERSGESKPRAIVLRSERFVPGHLLVCVGARVGRRYLMFEDEIRIGRTEESAIAIDDEHVSVRHAVIVRKGARYRLRDLGSANGTLVNGQPVEEIELRDGDHIQIGMTVFRFGSGDSIDVRREAGLEGDDRTRAYAPAYGSWRDGGAINRHEARAIRTHVEDEVSFAEMVSQVRRILDFFWPYRFAITGLAAAGLVIGAASAFLFPASVAAYFDVRLHSKASENPLEKFEGTNVEFFRSAATTFRSTGLITKTMQALGDKTPTPADVQAAQDALQFNSTGSEPGSQTFMGSFRGAGPQKSLAFLEKHVELYLQGEIDKTLNIIKAQIDFLQSQLDDNEKELRTTEEKLLTFKKQNIDGLPDQARQYYDYLFELQKKQGDLEGEATRLDAEASVDRKRLAGETPLVESRSMATRPYQQSIVDVNRQLAEAHSRGLAEDHPDVKQLKLKLEELKRLAQDASSTTDDTEVERSRNPIYDSATDRLGMIRAQAAAARQERERLQKDQARIKGIVDKLPALEAEYADLTRSYDATKQLHTRIFEQLKTAQLQYELEKASASARYEIITAPRLEYVSPVKTVTKRAALLTLTGFGLGLMFAALMRARAVVAAGARRRKA